MRDGLIMAGSTLSTRIINDLLVSKVADNFGNENTE